MDRLTQPTLPPHFTLFGPQTVQSLVGKLATEIEAQYRDRCPHLVAVLDAAYMFIADLTRQMQIPHTVGFAKATSYGNDYSPTPEVKIILPPQQITDREVILVDTIVATGNTLRTLISAIRADTHSISAVTLMDTDATPKLPIPHLNAYTLKGNAWAIGYGLDYHGHFRNRPYVTLTRKP